MPATSTEPTQAAPDEVQGPIVGVREIEIAASPDAIWDVLTDLERWPEWNPDVKAMSAAAGEPAAGTVFSWKAGPGEITSTVVDAIAPRRISWTGRTFGIDAMHVWRIESHGDRTLVHTEESYRGLMAKLFRSPLRRTLQGALDRGCISLKREVERRAAG